MRTCVFRGPDSVTRLESVILTRGRICERRSVVCVSPLKLVPMPSVEMKRSTRIFVPKSKEAEGVKVLRSGRTLCVESGETKIKVSGKVTDGQDLVKLIDDSNEAMEDLSEETRWRNGVGDNGGESDPMVIDDVEKAEPQLENRVLLSGCLNKRFGLVYSRKRKRLGVKKSDSLGSNTNFDAADFEKSGSQEKNRFGLHFFHRKRRRTVKTAGSLEKAFVDKRFLSVTAESSCDGLAGVVNTVLRYLSAAKVGLVELSGFFQSQPLAGVFASYGICFSLSDLCNKTSGFCKIYGTRELTPLFDLDFSCVPHCFIQLHASMWFRSFRLSSLLLLNADRTDEDYSELDDVLQCDSSRTHSSNCSSLAPESSNLEGSKMLNTPFGVSKPAVPPIVATRSSQRKRKRSLLTRRARNPSFLGMHRGGPSALDSGSRKSCSNGDIKLLKSTLLALGKEIESVSCSVNLLAVESDRCYRESGACVTIELSASNEWILAVRIDGSLRCYHRAQKGKEVKPTCTNRYTYAIIWCVEAKWKLEFTERMDWAIFKELFKVCGDRNIVIPPPAMAIPIPGVCEVSDCDISHDAPYVRPESYIKMNDDELSRALLKRSANYDMGCEDEEWLNTFNSKFDPENDLSVRVAEGTFELMIDRFEKAAFCQPDDFSEEKAPEDLCLDLASREVVEAVYSYWMAKRKQNHGPLLKVFQLNEPKKIPVMTKPVLRKKRSMKQRHTHHAKGTPSGRGKELRVLQAIAAQQSANEEKTAMLEVEQARAAARSALEFALAKRRIVQTLMENVDLAVYKATMALRIAEAAQATEPDQAAAHFLD